MPDPRLLGPPGLRKAPSGLGLLRRMGRAVEPMAARGAGYLEDFYRWSKTPEIERVNPPEYTDWLYATQQEREARERGEMARGLAEERDSRMVQEAAATSALGEDVGTGFQQERYPTYGQRQDLRGLMEPQTEQTRVQDMPPGPWGVQAQGQALDAREYLQGLDQASAARAGQRRADELFQGMEPPEQRRPRIHPGLGEMPGPKPGDPTQYLSPKGQGMEDRIADVPRQERLDKLQALAQISEGLNLAGRSLAGISGAPIPQMDDTAVDLRMEAARAEDEITPAEIRAARAYGLNLSPGMRRSQVRSLGLMPAMTALRRDEERYKYGREEGAAERESREKIEGARAQRDWMKWAMDQERAAAKEATRVRERQEDIDRRTRWRAEDMERSEAKMGKFSEKELQEITQIDDAIQGMEQILQQRQQEGYVTGPLDKPLVRLGQMTGIGVSDKSTAWRQKVRMQLATWIRDMAGAALGPKEAELYLDAIPTESDQEEVFDSKLRSVIEGLRRKRQTFLDTRRWAGKTTGPFEMIQYKSPTRGVFEIPAAEAQEFEADPLNADAVRQRR